MFSLERALTNYGVRYFFLCEGRKRTPRIVIAYTVDEIAGTAYYGYSVRYRPTDKYHEPAACDVAAVRMLSNGEQISIAKDEKPVKTILKYLASSKNKTARKWFPILAKNIAKKQLKKIN